MDNTQQPDTLVSDLVHDAALLAQDCLNNLPAGARTEAGKLLAAGSELETRVRMRQIGTAEIAVLLVDPAGQCVVLGSSSAPVPMH